MTAPTPESRRRITLERTYTASIEDVWELWTTKEGLESWWGPDGFRVEVRSIDLRPGGELHYAMIAVAPEMVAFMKKNGMQVVQELSARHTEVVENKRLRYRHRADFIAGVEPYENDTLLELAEKGGRVHLSLTFSAMHDDVWTQRQTAGWKNELEKLAHALAK